MIGRIEESIGAVAARYRGLGPAARRAVWALLGVELVAIAAAERDIQRRSADGIRGPKLLWRVVVTQNLIGPAAYAFIGRRRTR